MISDAFFVLTILTDVLGLESSLDLYEHCCQWHSIPLILPFIWSCWVAHFCCLILLITFKFWFCDGLWLILDNHNVILPSGFGQVIATLEARKRFDISISLLELANLVNAIINFSSGYYWFFNWNNEKNAYSFKWIMVSMNPYAILKLPMTWIFSNWDC